MPTRYDMAAAGLGFDTQFTNAVRMNYTAEYRRYMSRIDGGALDPIDVLRQNVAVNFIIRKRWICRIGGEHYYNAAIGGADRHMFFLDASLAWKTERMEYSLEARNLTDIGTFRSAAQSDITDYVYSYRLRPASVMFTIKFSLR